MLKIFISYARKDASETATNMYTALRDSNYDVWLDREEMRGGREWKKQIHDAISDSVVIILFITPLAMQSKNVEYEWQTALELKKRVIGIELIPSDNIPHELSAYHYHSATTPDLYDNMLPRLYRDLRELELQYAYTDESTEITESLESHIQSAVRAHIDRLKNQYESGKHKPLIDPYKELIAFDITDERIFFGRNGASRNLRGKVFRDRLAVLHARSGAGKSSIINAGLIPALLTEGYIPVYARVAKTDPVDAIKKAFTYALRTRETPEELTRLSLSQFLGIAETELSIHEPAIIIILDQFEEFFVYYPQQEQRAPFIKALADCLADEHLRVRFLISLRKDYFSDLAEFESRLPNIFQNQYKLPQMTPDQAREAIIGPVNQVDSNVMYDSDLLDELLADLTANDMELPHLQIICSQLYSHRPENQLTIALSDYENNGKAKGILGNYLKNTLEQFQPEERKIADDLLYELVSSQSTKRIMEREQLIETFNQDKKLINAVLRKLVKARLLRRDVEADDGSVYYEMAHEYLIEEIIRRAESDPEKIEIKRIKELLRGAVYAWNQGIVMSQDILETIYKKRDDLGKFSDAELTCILISSMIHLQETDYWMKRDVGRTLQLLSALVDNDNIPIRLRTRVIGNLPRLGENATDLILHICDHKNKLLRTRAYNILNRSNPNLSYVADYFEESDLKVSVLDKTLLTQLSYLLRTSRTDTIDYTKRLERLKPLLSPNVADHIIHIFQKLSFNRQADFVNVMEYVNTPKTNEIIKQFNQEWHKRQEERIRKEEEERKRQEEEHMRAFIETMIEEGKRKEQKREVEEKSTFLETTPDFDSMSPEELMNWMETLAARQSASEGFTSQEADPMDWLENLESDVDLNSESNDTDPMDWLENLARENYSNSESDDADPIAWLDMLASTVDPNSESDNTDVIEVEANIPAWLLGNIETSKEEKPQTTLPPRKLLQGSINEKEDAIEILRKEATDDAIELLIATLEDSSWHVKIKAIYALGEIKTPKAIPALTKLLTSSSSKKQSTWDKTLLETAKDALQKIGTEEDWENERKNKS